ncbi:MAG: hypothetical protein Q9227_000670 [Pyrenula ochraceoflavens]
MAIDLCCISSRSKAARAKNDKARLSNVKIVRVNAKSRPSSQSSAAIPRALQVPLNNSKSHLLDEKVPNLIQSTPLQAGSSERNLVNDLDTSSEISSAVSISGTRIVSIISTERSESRLSSSTERDSARLPSLDDSRPPPPYSRNPPSLPHNEPPLGFPQRRRSRSRSMSHDDFRNYVQSLRQRLHPEGPAHLESTSPALTYTSSHPQTSIHCTWDSIASTQTDDPQTYACRRSQRTLPTPSPSPLSTSSRSPSPPNAPLISRLTTPSNSTTFSDGDSVSAIDFADGEVPGSDFSLFPRRSESQQSWPTSPIQDTVLLPGPEEGLFEQLDQRMRFEAWRATAEGQPGLTE